MRRGQAMVETMLAVVFVTVILFGLLQLSHLLTTKILLDHAAARAARAKSVGFNDFMARGVLEYERWEAMKVDVSSGGGVGATVDASIQLDVPRFFSYGDGNEDPIRMEGAAEIESHFPLYMNDQGR